MYEYMNVWMYEYMHEWMNEWMNDIILYYLIVKYGGKKKSELIKRF